MKTQIQISYTALLIVVLMAIFQSCAIHKIPMEQLRVELDHHGIKHLEDCPVVCKERSVFFETHLYDPYAVVCAYCGQKQNLQTAALK